MFHQTTKVRNFCLCLGTHVIYVCFPLGIITMFVSISVFHVILYVSMGESMRSPKQF